MPKVYRIRKGLNIPLIGEAEKVFTRTDLAEAYSVKPTDFTGLTPKLCVEEGDKVKAGSPLFFDKYRPGIQFTSPVSGEVQIISRGERRKLLEVVIKPDTDQQYVDFGVANPKNLSRSHVVEKLLQSDVWPVIKQRPYAIIANPTDSPKQFLFQLSTQPRWHPISILPLRKKAKLFKPESMLFPCLPMELFT